MAGNAIKILKQPVGLFSRQQTAAVGLFAKQISEVLAEVGMIRQYFQLILYTQFPLVCLLIIVSPALLFAGRSVGRSQETCSLFCSLIV